MTLNRARRVCIAAVALAFVAPLAWLWPELHAPAVVATDVPGEAQVDVGHYLVRAGNCAGCHALPGRAELSGGKPIPTPFGDVFSTNLTPDPVTGIGAWTSTEFWRAMHHGISKDGRRLYPAFPYADYTLLSREDSDAMFAYLQTLQPQRSERTEPTLRFPYNTALALMVWRRIYFRARSFQADASRGASWNRGAYLTEGLGHCGACHRERDWLGGSKLESAFRGGQIPVLGWYAPALDSYRGLDALGKAELGDLLAHGISQRDVLTGPMAEVALQSLQHLSRDDIDAIVTYLSDLPYPDQQPPPSPGKALGPRERQQMSLGAAVYQQHCRDCHGALGDGKPHVYPALAGNSLVTSAFADDVVRTVLLGGFPASTSGNPRPYGMPPYAHALSDEEVAAVSTYVRRAWGNKAGSVSMTEIRGH